VWGFLLLGGWAGGLGIGGWGRGGFGVLGVGFLLGGGGVWRVGSVFWCGFGGSCYGGGLGLGWRGLQGAGAFEKVGEE